MKMLRKFLVVLFSLPNKYETKRDKCFTLSQAIKIASLSKLFEVKCNCVLVNFWESLPSPNPI